MIKKILNMDVGALLRTEIPLPFRSGTARKKDPSDVKNPLDALDVKKAMDDHMAWLERLKSIISGESSEKLDIGVVSAPNLCALGAWIYLEETQVLRKNPEYLELRVIHKEFHELVGTILAETIVGDTASAMEVLRGDLRVHSDKIQLLLARLHGQK